MAERLITLGTFDTPHLGHAHFLRQCEDYADEVVVGVNTDEFVHKYKERYPIFNQEERLQLIANLGYTALFNQSAGRELIDQVKPNIIAIGSDWARKDYYSQIDVDQDYLDENNIHMLYIPYTKGISSTEMKRRLRYNGSDE